MDEKKMMIFWEYFDLSVCYNVSHKHYEVFDPTNNI